MKQHILPKQLKEITFKQAKLLLGNNLNRRQNYLLPNNGYRNDEGKWASYHHRKVSVGIMIEFLGDNLKEIVNNALIGFSVHTDYSDRHGYLFRPQDIKLCDALWEAVKYKLKQ